MFDQLLFTILLVMVKYNFFCLYTWFYTKLFEHKQINHDYNSFLNITISTKKKIFKLKI